MDRTKALTLEEASKRELLSLDLVAQRFARLREVVPEAFGDGGVDWDLFQNLMKYPPKGEGEGENKDPTYHPFGLVWRGMDEAREEAAKRTTKCLRPQQDKSLSWDQTQNVFIEGENLEVLRLLAKAYWGKVKIIYIDPPYNTGNDKFFYPDKFKQRTREYLSKSGQTDENGNLYTTNKESDGRFHSQWLSMMYPRLAVARNFLCEDGVIFVSIDDREVHRLRMIMDEIFGEENFVVTFHVEMSVTQGMKVASAQKGKIVKNAEFVVCYCKNKNFLSSFEKLYEGKDWDKHYRIHYNEELREKKTLKKFIDESIKNKKLKEKSYTDIEKAYSDDEEFRKFLHDNSHNIFREAMWEKEFFLSSEQEKKLQNKEIIRYSDSEKSYLIFRNSNGVTQQLLSLKMAIGKTDDFNPTYGLRKIRGNWWKEYYKDMMNVTKEGTTNFKNGKKPVRLVKDLIRLIKDKNAIVLDFFAGSCTTAHAVMQLNAEDSGNRRFLMVQVDEKTPVDSDANKSGYPTVAEIGRERIRRATKNIQDTFSSKILDLGFKSFLLDSSNFEIWENMIEKIPDLQKNLKNHIDRRKENRTNEDLIYEVLLKHGSKLTDFIHHETIGGHKCHFVGEDKNLMFCLENKVKESLLDALENMNIPPQHIFLLDYALENNASLRANFYYSMKDKARGKKEIKVTTL